MIVHGTFGIQESLPRRRTILSVLQSQLHISTNSVPKSVIPSQSNTGRAEQSHRMLFRVPPIYQSADQILSVYKTHPGAFRPGPRVGQVKGTAREVKGKGRGGDEGTKKCVEG